MLNGTQRNIMEATLQFMLDGISEDVSKDDATAGFRAITDEGLYQAQRAHFERLGILASIDDVRRIYQHPCPQNRAVGSQYVGQEVGLAVWRDPISKRICKEPLGLLGLTATNDETAAPVTAQDVRVYIDEAISEELNRLSLLPDETVSATPIIENQQPVSSLFPGNEQSLVEQARRLMHERKRLEAIAVFSQLLELKPEHAPYYYERGRLRAASGQRREALGDFNRAIALGSQTAQTFVERGYTRENFGDSLGALADYNRALSLEPRHAFALSQRAGIYLQQNKITEGLADYQVSLSIKEDATTYSNRGTWLAMLKRYEEALADFRDSLRLRPNQRDVEAMQREVEQQLQQADAQPAASRCLLM
jgi:tetratricopeptide (TPR) repeat protein